jgi:hypothetical protein
MDTLLEVKFAHCLAFVLVLYVDVVIQCYDASSLYSHSSCNLSRFSHQSYFQSSRHRAQPPLNHCEMLRNCRAIIVQLSRNRRAIEVQSSRNRCAAQLKYDRSAIEVQSKCIVAQSECKRCAIDAQSICSRCASQLICNRCAAQSKCY